MSNKIGEGFERIFRGWDFRKFTSEIYKSNEVQAMWSGYSKCYKSRDEEIKKAYDYLSACGVPKERAGTIHNGIDVLATRFRKEISLDAGEKAELRAKIKKLRDALRQAYIDGYESGHNDTVESQYGDSEELFIDWLKDQEALKTGQQEESDV